MEHALIKQLDFVRSQTLKAMQGITEEEADRIPEGFRNNLRWQFGHIYVVLERHAFQYIGLPLHLPEGYKEQFEYNTSPLTRPESVRVPALPEIEGLMKEQVGRIREALGGRMQEEVPEPYRTSSGALLKTPEDFLSLDLYHEGMHFGVIKLYKALLSL
ncbi:DinB family protein [Paenibacillus aurantius]|uniref:DinB family protein n=1 Tax=Paenibacillus aurantius TaxID=2918900 RepID=A0AA96LF33_9BACL|nr:DinB family protein [Paenibacillus aurantius]WNQ11868.1 DinB family protein [Paenibacillus aurantius]